MKSSKMGTYQLMLCTLFVIATSGLSRIGKWVVVTELVSYRFVYLA